MIGAEPAATPHPPSETTPPTTTDEGEIDPQKSIERLRNAIAAADTGIGACVVAHAAAPPEEH
jgi:hypothetical protein